MSTPILATKLYIPPPRPKVISRPRLIEKLNEGLTTGRKLSLISAPAGFGKTTLVSEWVTGYGRPTAWLSLDEGDNDSTRFVTYLIAALQTIAPHIGKGLLDVLQSPWPPPTETILTTLLNESSTIDANFILVLDDYHVIDSKPIDDALTFLIEHLPPQMHLILTTREDPRLPLARLRVRNQLIELRAASLRFTPDEAADFLNQAMGLNLSSENITALDKRTEGWIAGLQLAALSMQGQHDIAGFIESFTGSHHFVMDYLLEEVLDQQSESIQSFLLRTSMLDRLCGSLCDAILLDSSASSQDMLEYLEHANLFLTPLDNERRWYRYHHLFADLLRQRLHNITALSSTEVVTELHSRASLWYEENGLEIEAFQHAAAANDVERAERLIEGQGVPLQFRGAGNTVLKWLKSLPTALLNARPSLWVTYASSFMMTGQPTSVEEKLRSAESALATSLQGREPDKPTQDLVGRIASMRATLGIIHHDAEAIITQSRRALKYLHPDNLPLRTATTYTLGYAYQLQGNRAAASQTYTEVISISKSFGDSVYTTAATLCLGQVQESDNQLYLAAKTYRRAVHLVGDPPQGMAGEAFLGLARIYYQWNELDAAQTYGQHCLQVTSQGERLSTYASYCVFLARLRFAQRDVAGATAVLDDAAEFVRRHSFMFMMPDVAAAQVQILLHQGNLTAAAQLAQMHTLPISQARVHLAQGDRSAALALLEPVRQQAEEKGWQDERLKVMVLQAVIHHVQREWEKARQVLGSALALAEPGGCIRIFVDEGLPIAQLLSETAFQGIKTDYKGKLVAAFEAEKPTKEGKSYLPLAQPLIDPLSPRELEVLQLMAQGLSNREISQRLFLALSTVKGHNRIIFDKLQVQRRTEAIARARELELL
jgi:LuxR family transcriptional regulator, maltose regulon positive regulatory protein